jgi:hypothetical protein
LDLSQEMATRRRSPSWVREMSDREVHSIAFRLNYQRQQEDLSGPQEWLYDALVSELAYRRRRARWPERRCSCELCWGPFDFEPDED